jgi:ABC-type uncharacterized transport system involved in gliding motility auxiliary subunit
MLSLDDIIALARAGYTADQINQMAAAVPAEQIQEQPAPDPQPATPAPQASPAEPTPQQAPEQQQSPAGQPDPYQRLLDELGLIRNQLQANNRSSAQQPVEQQLTGEQVLANIIAPPRRTTK